MLQPLLSSQELLDSCEDLSMRRRYPPRPRRGKVHNTIALLDKAKKLCSPQTDYRLAKTLGVSVARMSNWRRGINAPDTLTAWKLAKLLKMDPSEVIAYIEEDRAIAAKDPTRVEFWKQQLPRILPSIAIGTALLLAAKGTLIGGDLGGTHWTLAHLPLYTLYIMRMLEVAITAWAALELSTTALRFQRPITANAAPS